MTAGIMVMGSPLLAGGPPGWLAYGALAVAAVGLTAFAVYEASKAADTSFADTKTKSIPISTTITKSCDDCNIIHRGRVQAQGNYLEKSLPWGQPTAPTAIEGLALLAALYAMLTKAEKEERAGALLQAQRWVQARPPGGVYAITKASFPKPALRGGVRIDVEILNGWAYKA